MTDLQRYNIKKFGGTLSKPFIIMRPVVAYIVLIAVVYLVSVLMMIYYQLSIFFSKMVKVSKEFPNLFEMQNYRHKIKPNFLKRTSGYTLLSYGMRL